MSLRTRIAALTAGAVAIAVIVLSVATFILVRQELREQIDQGLVRRVAVARVPRIGPEVISDGPYILDNAFQIIDGNGIMVPATTSLSLPVHPRDLAIANGQTGPYLHDETVAGVHIRVVTASLVAGQAIQLARVLTEIDVTLRNFLLILLVLAGMGVAGAAGAGYLVAQGAARPVRRLTKAAEHVARTKELDARIEIEPGRTDEIGRLATSFNEMLGALQQSRDQQQQLVADASHELRTPLTSLRTNVEVLGRNVAMGAEDRARVLADLRSELEELSSLVGELVELATDQRGADAEEMTDLDLSEVVSSAVDRAHRRTGREIVVDGSPSPVFGRPLGLERAVSNLIENAVKWGPDDQPIDVRVGNGQVEVSDRGPGIDKDDRPKVFDRFYRSAAARAMPGSGLGLSIVKQVVDSHGGTVWAREREGGGSSVGFAIPAQEPVSQNAEEASADS